jgi:hypothetical protein
VLPENIPDSLKQLPQWVCWKYEWNEKKWTKPPCKPSGYKAATTNEKDYSDFNSVLAAYQSGGFDGIGFCMDAKNNIVGIDLDDCIVDGSYDDLAQSFLESFSGTYAEISPSGNGIRIFCAGSIPRAVKTEIEMYQEGRYLTITGHKLKGAPDHIVANQAALTEAYETYKTKKTPDQPLPSVAIHSDASEWTQGDKDLCAKIAGSKQGEKFQRLFNGDTSGHNDDDSAADLGLCSILAFWCKGDMSQVDRIFRQSKLYRTKWDEKHGATTYGQMTLQKAARQLPEVVGCRDNIWQPPEPLITHTEAAPYPLEALPPIIREAVGEVVAFVKCPVALAACSALSVVASVSQCFADIRRDNRLEGPIGLYLISIGDSGERKSTADKAFTSSLDTWEEKIREAYAPLIKRYKASFDAWGEERSGLLASIKEKGKKGLCTKEAYEKLYKLNDEEPRGPIVPRIKYGDTTPEKLSRNLSTLWPVAGILSSEAGVVFGGHSMGKDSMVRNMSALNLGWDGKTTSTDRQTSESYAGREVRITMGLAVQPATIRNFIDNSKGLARGIGFLARFLVAWPESTQGWRNYERSKENWPALDAFDNRILSLLNSDMPIDETGKITPAMMTLSEKALVEWIHFHDDIEIELRPGRSMADARDVASKCADNAVRIAGNFHLFAGAGIGEQVNEATMQAACTLAEWHLYEAKRLLGEIASPIEIVNAQKLDAWMLAYCRENKVTEIPSRLARQYGPSSLRSKINFDNALNELSDLHRVRDIKDGKKRIIQINPDLLEGK